jgi:hypothetical protein
MQSSRFRGTADRQWLEAAIFMCKTVICNDSIPFYDIPFRAQGEERNCQET